MIGTTPLRRGGAEWIGKGVPKVAKTKYACEILGEAFATACSLRTRCRSIIDIYLSQGSSPEEEMSEQHSSFFIELVRLRDPGRIVEGVYVRRVVRCCRDGQVGRHVRFEYSNGMSDLIGWSKLCGGKQATFTQVSNAMREAIRHQMQQEYTRFFEGRQSGVCPRTGVSISYSGGVHGDRAVVHHEGLSFAQIRDMWFQEALVSPEHLHLKDMFDGGGHTLADDELSKSWKAFHKLKANLVVVSEIWHRKHHAACHQETMEQVA